MTILVPYQQTPEGQAAIHRAVAEAQQHFRRAGELP